MDFQKRINKLIRRDLERCETLYSRLKRELKNLEQGSISERKGVYSWCRRIEGRQVSRKIKDDEQLIRLRKRQYIKRGLPVLEQRIKNNRFFLRNDVLYDPVAIGEAMPEQYRDMERVDVFLDGDINPDEWISKEFTHGQMFEDKKLYKMDDSTWVRSKSETMIAMRLKEKGFHIRYEPEVRIGDKLFYPDFETVLANNRRNVYYEHFGMMDDPAYAVKALQKLETYASHGIILNYNLVISYETRSKPLSLADIDIVIEKLHEMDKN